MVQRTIKLNMIQRYGFLRLKSRTITRQFRGSGTVWHDKETGARPLPHIELRLSEMNWLLSQSV